MFEIAPRGGSAAARPGAGGVPELGQVPEQDPGVVALGLVAVITLAHGERPEGDQLVRLPGIPVDNRQVP
jgi:hypothetical protein